MVIEGDFRTLVLGHAEGPVASLGAPLSLWGGLDLATGRICDVTHPNHGLSLAGTILVMPGARGSSSSSSALVEAIRTGLGPCGIILSRIDPILVIGALVASDLYGVQMPVLLADEDAWQALPTFGDLLINAPATAQAVVSVR